MTAEEQKRTAIALADYKREKGLSLEQLATEIGGISYAQVSNAINVDRLEFVSEKLVRRIAAFLKMDDWKLIETSNYATIKELAWEAQEYSRFFGIYGNSGFGKTATLRDYKRTNPNCYYVLADVLMSGKKHFLAAIQKAMGISTGASPADMMNAICNVLDGQNKPIIIIDDAGKLSESNLRVIQLLYDRTERKLGLIIAGTPYLKDMLEKGVTRNKMGYDELYRRVEHWQHLSAPSPEEKMALCQYHGIADNKAVVNMIVNTTKNYGAVRAKITKALRLKDKGALTADALQTEN